MKAGVRPTVFPIYRCAAADAQPVGRQPITIHRYGRLFLASAGTDVIGCACARTIRPGLAEIKRVYVRPSGRGNGTGRALIQTLIADLRDAGYTTVRLDTGTFMTAAEKLYRSLGFQDIAPYDESETPKDFRQHAIFLELSL